MTDSTGSPTVPSDVPAGVAERLAELDEGQLRQTAEYVQELLNDRQPVSADIETREGEELVRVTEHDGYTAVVKRQPCSSGCDDCLHGPYLYHVRREDGPRDDENLHWSYIGRVDEST